MVNDWLETWHGEFDIPEMQDPGRWRRYRSRVRHPATIFSPEDIDRARENVSRHPWARKALETLLERVDAAGAVSRVWARTYVPSTTPYSPHFTMCPKCEFAPMHGAYDWSPDDPAHIRCKGCGAVYPNDDYPEDVVFESRFDPRQKITLYGGKSWQAYGYAAIRSSFSGHARIHRCRHAANTAEDLALAYALTGEREYATGAALVLKRFADVHPKYLVHSSYGDIADLDPKIAATRVDNLPEDEWCPPGNRPNRKLHPGYWAVLRWGSSGGMEGASLQKLILAYDLVAETLSDAEKRHIEHDLLLDAAVMLFSDNVINNKTGMNRCAVGLIGIVCGDPLLIRFGLDGFVRAVRDWWLPDGGTPESIGYAGMMLSGIWRLAEALRRYSDPDGAGYPPAQLHRVDLYSWPRYRAVWQNMARPLLPDLDYPLLADNRLPCHLSAMFADVLARNYPSENHRMLQRDIAKTDRCYAGRIAQFWYGGNLDTSAAFYRRPVSLPDQPPRFADDLGPHLNVGTQRTGRRGNGAAVILNGADFKGHHHHDHLNLYYWKDRRELLTDLGYLWDMEELRYGVNRTFAHNLVVVDGKEQMTRGRRATFHLFSACPRAKVMEASSNVYPGASIYRRTIATVGSGPGEYVVDIFRVRGGERHDWVMHGPDRSIALSGIRTRPADEEIYDLTRVRAGRSVSPWSAAWTPGSRKPFRVHVPAHEAEQVYIGQGFGQRKARDRGATVPYIVRRRVIGDSTFVTVYADGEAVTSVRILYLNPATMATVVEVATNTGRDLLISAGDGQTPETVERQDPALRFNGRFGLISAGAAWLVGGACLQQGEITLGNDFPAQSGPVLETRIAERESGLVTTGDASRLRRLEGGYIFVTDSRRMVRAYPVLALAESRGHPMLVTRRGDRGYDIRAGETWTAWTETFRTLRRTAETCVT